MSWSAAVHWRLIVATACLLFTATLAENNGANSIFTCEGKCGHFIGLPCSCDARCYIYGNCCESTEIYCPDLFFETLSKFEYLMASEVMCSENNVFFISSCPRPLTILPSDNQIDGQQLRSSVEEKRQHDFTLPVSKAKYTELPATTLEASSANEFVSFANLIQETTPTQTPPHFTIEEAISNAPVLDKANGIIYINSQIFSCHKQNNSDPIRWRVQIDVHGTDPELILNSLEEDIEPDKITYLPPLGVEDSLAGAPCIAESKNECKEGSPQLMILCRRFISYVKRGIHGTIFKNRFCYYCITNATEIPWPATYVTVKINNRPLSIVMSLSKNNQQIVYAPKPGSFLFNWSNVTCRLRHPLDQPSQKSDVSQIGLEQDNKPCTIESCKPDFSLRPDGKCRTAHEFKIAVDDDEQWISGDNLDKLSRFFGRCLEKHHGGELEVEEASQSHEVYLDRSLQKVLYSGTLYLQLPFGTTHIDLLLRDNGLIRVAAMVKVLQNYFRQPSSSTHSATWTPANLTTPTSVINSRILKPGDDITYDFLFEGRGQLYNNQTVMVCMATSTLNGSISVGFRCWEDPFYESDLPYIDQYADCVSVFSETQPSLLREQDSAETFSKSFKEMYWQIGLVVMVTLLAN